MEYDYEAMDWPAEAKRVAAAFGAEKFKLPIDVLAPCRQFYLTIEYARHFRYFKLTDQSEVNISYADIKLQADGSTEIETTYDEYSMELAKGLFQLGLLTSEIEAALEVSISAQEKLEWSKKG